MSHQIERHELDGHEVKTMIAASSKDDKALYVVTTVGPRTTSIYRVYNYATRVHHDYETFADGVQAYNWI